MKKYLPLIVSFAFISCAQKQIRPDQVVQRFGSQIYFQDKLNKKSHQMTMEVVARKNQKMRLDAKMSLGLHLASVVTTLEKIHVALHAEKKSYEGPATQKALQRSLGFPLHPLVLHAMIYRQALKGAGWSCNIRSQKVQRCVQAGTGMVLSWEDQDEGATMVVADSKSFNLQWRLLPAENVTEKPNYFELKIPDSYEKLRL